MQKAVALVAEKQEMRAEAERILEEEYDYLTLGAEVDSLKTSIRDFMIDQDVAQAKGDGGHWSLIRRTKTKWNPAKLKKILSKGQMIKVSTFTVDPDKLDDMVRKGKIDKKKIAPALEQTPEKPHIRWFDSSDEDASAEESALKAAMGE